MDKKRSGIRRSILIMTLVWAFSWGMSWLVGWSVVREFGLGFSFTQGGELGGLVGGIIAGVSGGIGTAITLKLANPSTGLRNYHTILLALGWSVIVFYDWSDGFVVSAPIGQPIEYGLGGPLSGILGGLLTASVLLWANYVLGWKRFFLIIGGWTLGFSLAGLIAWTIGFQIAVSYVYGPIYNNDPGLVGYMLFTLISVLCGGLAGCLGGAATIGRISSKSPPQDKISEPTSGNLLFE